MSRFQVIKESAELALSWVKTHSYSLGITSKRAQDPLRIPDAMIDVHLHLPAGAQKKDGPSAGVAMVRTRTYFYPSSDFGSLTREWAGLRDCIALDGQVRPAHYGNDRRGACAHPATRSNLMFGLDHAPRSRLTCRRRQRESTGCASCGRKQGDRTVGEP